MCLIQPVHITYRHCFFIFVQYLGGSSQLPQVDAAGGHVDLSQLPVQLQGEEQEEQQLQQQAQHVSPGRLHEELQRRQQQLHEELDAELLDSVHSGQLVSEEEEDEDNSLAGGGGGEFVLVDKDDAVQVWGAQGRQCVGPPHS